MSRLRPVVLLMAATAVSCGGTITPTSEATGSPGVPATATSTSSASSPSFTPTPTAPAPTPTPVPTGTWNDAGSMARGRASAPAVLLRDGRVLIVGGGNQIGATAELWDPGTDAWSPTGSLNKPRADFALVRLADG